MDGARNNIDSLTNMLLFATNIGGFSRTIKLSQYEAIKEDPYAVLQFNRQVEAFFNNYNDTYRYLDIQYYIMLNTLSGYRFNTITETTNNKNIEDVYDWVEDVRQKDGEILWVPTYNDRQIFGYDRYVFTAARVLKADYSSTSIGLLFLVVNESSLYNSFKKLQTDDNEILIVDQKGNVVSHQNKSLLGKKWDGFDTLYQDNENSYSIVEKDNKKLMVVQRKLKSTGWKIIEITPVDNLMRQLSDFNLYLITLLIISILLCIFISYFVSFHLTVPITNLSNGMKRVSKGDLNVQLQRKADDEIGMLVTGFNRMISDIRLLFENVKKEQKLKNQAEIKYLQAQINPHFIYNTLNSTRCMIQMGRNDDASGVMILLTRLIRNVLDNKKMFVPLDEELDSIRDYVTIQNFRCSNTLFLVCEIASDVHFAMVPKLILQPLVENSIFHGIANKPDNGTIGIAAARDGDGTLVITVRDNGAGIDSGSLSLLRKTFIAGNDHIDNHHIGLANIQNRILQIYGDKYGLSIDSVLGEGTSITLRLPFQSGLAGNNPDTELQNL